MQDERTALIFGATGQDGRFMTRHLIEREYRVVGASRRPVRRGGAEGIPILACSLTDFDRITEIVREVRPREIYNFAAFSTGSGMFEDPVAMGDVNGQGPVRILEAIRQVNPAIRFCQASSSEMFGARSPVPQSEATRLDPRSPYGAAKQYAHVMIDVYRNFHGLFACSAILYNHESELRPETFVSRKVTRAAARIAAGLDDHVTLGNLDARRDWGFAGDYVDAMHLMLQAPHADDYVIATGETHSVRDVCEVAFGEVGLDYRKYVRSDPSFQRPRADVQLMGSPAKLRELGWRPRVTFEDMVRRMVRADKAKIDCDPAEKDLPSNVP